jgi:hypothetical protein
VAVTKASATEMLPVCRQSVGVSKVGGLFAHRSWKERFAEKSTAYIRETTMKESFSATPEAEAQKLARAIIDANYDDILHVARTLIATDNASLLDNTEFTARALSHGIVAKAYRRPLEQKMTTKESA